MNVKPTQALKGCDDIRAACEQFRGQSRRYRRRQFWEMRLIDQFGFRIAPQQNSECSH